MSKPRNANASVCERQGASRRFLSAERTPEPAASAVPLSTEPPTERDGASHRCRYHNIRRKPPAASAVPLTEARP